VVRTIDAGTRVARYLLQDLLGYVWEPIKRTDWMPGVIATSAAVSFMWGYILYTGDISSIWPIFGVTNQTLAGLALAIGTTLILRIATKKIYATFIVDNVRVWLQLLKTEGPIGMNTEREIVYCPIVPTDRPPDDKPLA